MIKIKNRIIYFFGLCIVTILLMDLFNKYYNVQPKYIKMNMEVQSDKDDQYSIYYDIDGKEQWNEENIDIESYTKIGETKELIFKFPVEAKNIRIDFGTKPGKIKIKNVVISAAKTKEISIDIFKKLDVTYNQMNIEVTGNSATIKSEGNDPFMVVNDVNELTSNLQGRPTYVTPLLMILSLLLGFITVSSLKQFKNSILFIKKAVSNKQLIINLAKNDFKQKYVASYLGVIWGFIQPLVTIAVYWFVFQVGFRVADVGDLPYILWFTSGIIPWFYFSEAFSTCSNVFIEYSYLVKKVVFKIESLSVIKIISTLFVQCFFILFLIIVASIYGYYPDVYTLQVIYYLIAMMVLVFTLSIFTSSVILFFRDLGQIISIIINVGFWATPIGWNIEMLPLALQKVFKLNPIFYIVTGYRDSFVEKVFFWERPYQTICFWAFCLIMLLVGVKVFNKLRPHFSDVI